MQTATEAPRYWHEAFVAPPMNGREGRMIVWDPKKNCGFIQCDLPYLFFVHRNDFPNEERGKIRKGDMVIFSSVRQEIGAGTQKPRVLTVRIANR